MTPAEIKKFLTPHVNAVASGDDASLTTWFREHDPTAMPVVALVAMLQVTRDWADPEGARRVFATAFAVWYRGTANVRVLLSDLVTPDVFAILELLDRADSHTDTRDRPRPRKRWHALGDR